MRTAFMIGGWVLLLTGCSHQTPMQKAQVWQGCLTEHVDVWRTSKDINDDTEKYCGHVSRKIPEYPAYMTSNVWP